MAADRSRGIVLDTSVVVAHLRGRLDVFALAKPDDDFLLPLVALAELYKGAEKSTRIAHNRMLMDNFLRRAELLSPVVATAEIYARTAAGLEAVGHPLPTNDIWIAASALEFDRPLATRDAHFSRVPGLTVLAW